MNKILLDTNFILTCVKQKIDFFTELDRIFGIYQVVVPRQVIKELKKLEKSKKLKLVERQAAEVSLELIKKMKLKIINLKGKEVDKAILRYLNQHNIILASLDRKLKSQVKNQKIKFLTIKRKKKIGFA